MKKVIIILLAVLPLLSMAQQKDKLNLKLGGFVSTEISLDTRQSVTSREGSVYLYPKAPQLDQSGEDINGNSSLSFSAIFSRVNLKLTGFNALGAKGTAFLEADYAGTSTPSSGLLRLRHAFVKLDWGKKEVLLGKYWHPMFVTSCYPKVLHWGAGLPFGVLSRVPQIRYTRNFSKGYISFTASSELDFKSMGPDGSSSKYMQNSSIPELNTQVKYSLSDKLTVGATLGMKVIKPRLVSPAGSASEEVNTSFHTNLWMQVKSEKFVWNVQSIYGGNMSSFVMLGGYGIESINDSGDYNYTNINTGSVWSDLYTTKGNVRYGFFAAITKNFGANNDLLTEINKENTDEYVGLYTRGSNISYAYQVGPRITYHQNKLVFGAQALLTAVAYGESTYNAEVENTDTVVGGRFMLSCKYSF